MAATWKPNLIIDSILKSKQEKYPNTVYVRDLKKILVSDWGLKDDSYHVLALGADGRVLFSHPDALSETQVQDLIAKIEGALAQN